MTFLKFNREKINGDYFFLRERFPELLAELEQRMETLELLDPDTALALRYLYVAMPLSDMANYRCDLFWDYAKHGVRLWKERPEVRAIPEDIYLEYVLLHRVNEEEIRPCRERFAAELLPRIQGLSAQEAIVETNFWCAEHVTYRAGDERTLSAAAVYERGYGRCGEESVFCINALRSIGIPARQVYVPRWAHCDDNHAWVEAWCDGEWTFLGACEPELRLNRGWFTEASSRAMMVHSRSFWLPVKPGAAAGADNGKSAASDTGNAQRFEPDEIVGMEGMVIVKNQLSRYALTHEVRVRVVEPSADEQPDGCTSGGSGAGKETAAEKPVPGAVVNFSVLNYAEYSPIATVKTDAEGVASLLTGYGTLYVEVHTAEGGFAETVLHAEREDRLTIRVSAGQEQACREDAWEKLDFCAPKDAPVNTVLLTPDQKEAGRQRLAEANRLRISRVENWENPERTAFRRGNAFGQLQSLSHTTSAGADCEAVREEAWREKMLEVLTEKDQTDLQRDILEEHLAFSMRYAASLLEDLFCRYVLNPRAGAEILSRYREELWTALSGQAEHFRRTPGALWDWILAHVRSLPDLERDSVITVPAKCLKYGLGSERSKRVLFVAAARTLGIPARLNPHDGSAEYWDGKAFVPAQRGPQRNARLIFTCGETACDAAAPASRGFVYSQNWSLGYWDGTGYISLRLETEKWENGKLALQVRAGRYRLITTNRLPNGNQFAWQKEFELRPRECREESLMLRPARLEDMLEEIAVSDFTLRTENGQTIPGSAVTGESPCVLLWLEESREPTEHILNELLEQRRGFAQYGGAIHFVVKGPKSLEDHRIADVLRVLPKIRVWQDDFSENTERLARRMYVDPEKLPLVIVFGGRLKGIYAASGYNVGMGAMLLKILAYCSAFQEEV